MSENEEVHILKKRMRKIRVRMGPCSRRLFEFLGNDGGWMSRVYE